MGTFNSNVGALVSSQNISINNVWQKQKTSSLDHSGPSVPTMLAYVDFRPWFKGWDQLDVNDQDKLKDLVTFNSTSQID
ncbi:unnamed protein product [Schistosoma guineensis]|nr:unnamed protein product [Schistosoma guineensis]